MGDFIKYQYQMGMITADDVRSFAGVWITQEEAEAIIKEASGK